MEKITSLEEESNRLSDDRATDVAESPIASSSAIDTISSQMQAMTNYKREILEDNAVAAFSNPRRFLYYLAICNEDGISAIRKRIETTLHAKPTSSLFSPIDYKLSFDSTTLMKLMSGSFNVRSLVESISTVVEDIVSSMNWSRFKWIGDKSFVSVSSILLAVFGVTGAGSFYYDVLDVDRSKGELDKVSVNPKKLTRVICDHYGLPFDLLWSGLMNQLR